MSLRAEMVGASGGLPGFALVLPSGWGSYDPDAAALRRRADAALSAVQAPQRAAWSRVLDEALASAKDWKGGVVLRVFAQATSPPRASSPSASWPRAWTPPPGRTSWASARA